MSLFPPRASAELASTQRIFELEEAIKAGESLAFRLEVLGWVGDYRLVRQVLGQLKYELTYEQAAQQRVRNGR